MSCYRTTNNKFFTAPPRMADGRHFTDYRPTFDLNNKIQNDNNIETSYDYRMFMSNNADRIMEVNRQHSQLKNGVNNCKQPYINHMKWLWPHKRCYIISNRLFYNKPIIGWRSQQIVYSIHYEQ